MDGKELIIRVYITLSCIVICSAAKCPPGTTMYISQCVRCKPRCQTCRAYDFCTSCKPTYWDRVCQKDCPSTCVSSECDDKTGHCKECPQGFYGDRCQYKCDTCADGECGLKQCTLGCKDGYYGEENYRGIIECKKCLDIRGCFMCSGENSCAHCESGYYKHESSETCSKCPKFCKDCTHYSNCTVCVDGRYGDTCEHVCGIPHCRNCSSSTGMCISCNPGFELANGTCICSKSCKSGCNDNGVCLGKCYDGYRGAFCELRCSRNCKACYKYNASHCTECPYNYYGDRCKTRCSPNCYRRDNTTETCARIDGTCYYGCVTGMYGARCGKSCPHTCINSYCQRNKGTCVYGCVEGFTGPRCSARVRTTFRARRTTRRPTFFDEHNTALPSITITTFTVFSIPTSTTPAIQTARPYTPNTKKPTNEDRGQSDTEDTRSEGDTNKSIQSRDAENNWYLYLCLGLGLCVAVFILSAFAGYFVKRRRHNPTQKPELNTTLNVIYSPEYNYIDYGECPRPIEEEQDVLYVEPQTENTYEHIGEEQQHQSHTTTRHCTYDSNGYIEPTTNSNRDVSPHQDYLTPIHNEANSSDVQTSAYEPLRQRDTTNTTYSALQSNSKYHTTH